MLRHLPFDATPSQVRPMRVFVRLPHPDAPAEAAGPVRVFELPAGEWSRTLALLWGRSPDDEGDLVLSAATLPSDAERLQHPPVEAVNAAVRRAEALVDPVDRARGFVAAAGLAQGNPERAVALYEAAIADDPTTSGAFTAIVGILEASGDLRGLERALTRQLDRLRSAPAGSSHHEAEPALLLRLADLREGSLDDHLGAIQALDELVRVRPTDLDARVRLAALLAAREENELALRCLEIAAEFAPTRAATYRSISSLAKRTGEPDRAYLASAALVQLGEADADDQATYQLNAPQTTLRLARPVEDGIWRAFAPADFDEDMAAIVAAIGPAASALRIIDLGKRLGLPPLHDHHRQDPEQSTVAAVRTIGWAAKVLRLPCPTIYARGDLPGGLATVAAATPSIVLGKAVLTGRTLPELAFLAVRELAHQAATGALATLYPTVTDFRDLIRTAISLYLPNVAPQPPVPGLREALAGRLGVDERRLLETAVRKLTAKSSSLDVLAFLRGTELLACRLALLVTGDVSVAGRVLATDGRQLGGLSAADRVRDLVPFSVSAPFLAARRDLGIGLGEAGGSTRMSVPPPRFG
jgi:tetratricopeptide (TPR) repeat protein